MLVCFSLSRLPLSSISCVYQGEDRHSQLIKTPEHDKDSFYCSPFYNSSQFKMSHKSKVKCLSYHSEASLLLCPSPSPCANFQPQRCCIRKCKFPTFGFIDVPFCSLPGSPKPSEQSKWPGFPPMPDLRLLGGEQERSAHSSRLLWLRPQAVLCRLSLSFKTMHPLPEAAGSVPPFSHIWYAWARLQERGGGS